MGVGNLISNGSFDYRSLKKYIYLIPKSREDYTRRIEVINLLLNTLTELCRVYDYKSLDEADERPEETRSILEYINAHLYEQICVDEIAEIFYFSRSHIDRFIKNATGYTLWNYIINKRIAKAAELLHSGVSARDAANMTGFVNYSTFYKSYVRIKQISPALDRPDKDDDPPGSYSSKKANKQ